MIGQKRKSYTKIEKPIFIIGTGRCGSTIFYNIFAYHPQVAWLSWFCDKYPKKPELNRWLMRSLEIPVLGDYCVKKAKPGECYKFWEEHCKGFSQPFRDLTEEDVTYKSKSDISFNYNHYSYLTRGRYIEQLKRWFKYFPKKQVLIIKSEDLFKTPQVIMNSVYEFLNIPKIKNREFKKIFTHEYDKIKSETKIYLKKHFKPYNEQLYEYLGINYNWENE